LTALVAKEFLQLRRDPRTLALMIFMPVLLMTMFGYAASFDVRHVATELAAGRPRWTSGTTGRAARDVRPCSAAAGTVHGGHRRTARYPLGPNLVEA
jgi:hypothetical protein